MVAEAAVPQPCAAVVGVKSPHPTAPVVDVAVGLLSRPDGALLLGSRPAGKPYAGWWEFPGGKFEAAENPHQALVREFAEELGVQVHASTPWLLREYRYEHAHVRLHFRRIVRWSGEPSPHEGQVLSWQHPAQLSVQPLLPASLEVVRWLRLPASYAISCAGQLGDDIFVDRLRQRLAQGLRLLQLREPAMQASRFEALFGRVLAECHAYGAQLLVNSTHPQRFWQLAGGVHLRSADLAALSSRPPLPWVAASCHDAKELAAAGALGCDFCVLGPVAPTASHPGAAALGWDRFAEMALHAHVPVFALGGLEDRDLGSASTRGAHGVASLSAAWRERAD